MSSPLVRLLRVYPDVAWLAFGAADWARLLRESSAHGLSGFALDAFKSAGVEVPSDTEAQLRRESMAVAATGLRTRGLLLRALEALERERVVPVVLKGYWLGKRLYPDPLFRPTTDVDLLVPGGQMEAAERALVSLGLRPMGGVVREYYEKHHHHLTFASQQGMVELHFQPLVGFGGGMRPDGWLERSVEGELDGRSLRYLCAEDELVYLATHAAQHLFQRLSWLFDLKLLLRATPALRWGDVAARAAEDDMSTPVYFALETAQRLLNAPVAFNALAALRPLRWQMELAHRVFTEDAVAAQALAGKGWEFLVTSSLMASTPPQMVRHALHHGWRAARRELSTRFPKLTPEAWRA